MVIKFDQVKCQIDEEIQQQQNEQEVTRKKSLSSDKQKKQIKSFLCSTPLKLTYVLLIIVTIVLIVVLLPKSEGSQQNEESPVWVNVKDLIEHKIEDNANYELTIIPQNNLKVLLITQKDLKLSEASLDVKVGSQNDPKEFQGLAHLLEHMLFMGSQKYPKEDAFSNLVSQSGGYSNAFTNSGNTNFVFESTHNNFLDIIDIWSRFFIDPLLKQDQLSREVNAVDSEYMNTLTTEDDRQFNLLIALSDEGHPFKTFSCGNTESLTKSNTQIQKAHLALHSFKKKFYSSENMSLVIKSDETLRSSLKNKILESFQEIPTKEINYSNFTEKDEQLIFNPSQPTVQPPITKPIHSVLFEKNQMKKLVINFFLDNSQNNNYSSIEFVRDLFEYGFEGINLCQLLEDRGLATNCKIETNDDHGTLYSYTIFEIKLQFIKNEDCIEEIVKSYFYFIDKVDNYPNKQKAYNQIKDIKKSLFNILDNKNIFQDYGFPETASYSYFLNQNKLQDILSQGQLYKSFNEEHFRYVMSVLTDPSKIIIIHKTSNSTFTHGKILLRDQVNDLDYTKTEISEDLQIKFKQYQDLDIPTTTPIADFGKVIDSILKVAPSNQDDNEPKLIFQSEKGRIYSQKDISTFKLPLQTLYLKFETDIFLVENINAQVSKILIQDYMFKVMKKKTLFLKLSGLSIEQYDQNRGFTIKITCFDSQVDQIIEMMKECIENIISSLFHDQHVFENYRQQMIDSINNFSNQILYDQFSSLLYSYIYQNQYFLGDILKFVKNAEVKDLKQIVEKFLDTYFLTFYAFGNIKNEQIKSSFNKLIAFSKRTEEYVFTQKQIITKDKPITIQQVFDSGDKSNSLCSVYYPIGNVDRLELTLLKLIGQPMHTQAFQYLRTELQLGYIVEAYVFQQYDYYGFRVLVQGSNHNPDIYDLHIEEFLQVFEEYLKNLSTDEIQSMQESLIQTLNIEIFAKFTDKSNHFWQQIDNKAYQYSKNQEMIQILEEQTFSSEDLLNFFQKYFKNSNSRFSIQLFSPSKMQQNKLPIQPEQSNGYSGNLGTIITSREEFEKQSFEYYTFQDQENKK